MKKTIYSILAATALGFAATSCTDQLDIPQKGVYESDSYYSNDEGAASGLALCMSYTVNMAFDVITGMNCLSDDVWAGGSNAGDQVGMHQLNGFYISTENDMVLSMYKSCYQMIYFCNLLIENIADNPDATPYMKQCLAEAYFLRGFAEYYLGVLWGNPPIVTHIIYSNDGVTNTEYGAMLEQAAIDIQTAINSGNLLEKTSLGDMTNCSHVTLAAAQGYLGKIYLIQKKYEDAAKMFDAIINTKKYDLWDGPYENIIKAASNWSDEGIFEINCPAGLDWDTGPTFVSYVYQYCGWREGDFVFTDMDRNAFGDFLTSGYGFCNPQDKLYQALIESDGVNGYRTISVVKTQDFVENTMGVKKGQTDIHGHGITCGWKNRFIYSDCSFNAEGGWSPFPAANFRYMRYAEVLLRAAEAHLLGDGNTTLALQYVNKVRDRAQASLYTSIDMEKVKLECQVELCMEGQRFIDLVRWGDAEKELGTQGQYIEALSTVNGIWTTVKDAASNPNYGFKSYNQYLPYPKQEVDQNPNIKQHEGY